LSIGEKKEGPLSLCHTGKMGGLKKKVRKGAGGKGGGNLEGRRRGSNRPPEKKAFKKLPVSGEKEYHRNAEAWRERRFPVGQLDRMAREYEREGGNDGSHGEINIRSGVIKPEGKSGTFREKGNPIKNPGARGLRSPSKGGNRKTALRKWQEPASPRPKGKSLTMEDLTTMSALQKRPAMRCLKEKNRPVRTAPGWQMWARKKPAMTEGEKIRCARGSSNIQRDGEKTVGAGKRMLAFGRGKGSVGVRRNLVAMGGKETSARFDR